MSAPRSATRTSLLVLAYLGFISLGLPDGLIGVGWPSIRTEFGVPVEALGFLSIAGTTGYALSSVVGGFTIARVGVGVLLAGSTALAAAALFGYAASPGLVVVVGGALLLGLGSGAIDSGLNAYAAANFGARHMNWLHASFGFGATLGPLIMTGVLAASLSWRWGYGIVAGAQTLLAVAFALTAGSWATREPAPAAEIPAPEIPAVGKPAPGRPAVGRPAVGKSAVGKSAGGDPAVIPLAGVRKRDTLALPAVWLGVLAFALYTAIEVAAGLWAYILLTDGRGMGSSAAGICVAAYWGSLFVGRLILGVVAERLGSGPVLVTSLAGMLGGAVLVALPAPAWLAVAGLILVGFAAAPVFPLLTLTTAIRVGDAHADRAIGLQVGAAGLGGALLPAGIGVLLGQVNVEALGPSLVALSVALLALYLVASRRAPAA